jgi:amino acid adenylation domain-containing protein/non-ribosomal peptide synthase protein (TIGR01720 family)
MKISEIETIYPLTLMQEQLIAAIRRGWRANGCNQVICEMAGELDETAWEEGWRKSISRHEAMRTSFVWRGVEKPVQLVHREFDLEIEKADWTGMSAEMRLAELERRLEMDREIGFDPSRLPLIKVGLIRTGQSSYWMIWNYDGLILDRQSVEIILKELVAEHELISEGLNPKAGLGPGYKDYSTWAGAQQPDRGMEWLNKKVKSLSEAAEIDGAEARNGGWEGSRTVLCQGLAAALRKTAERIGVREETLVIGAWSILMNRYGGQEEISYLRDGGRPPNFIGAGELVGQYTRCAPCRVEVRQNAVAGDWLKTIEEQGDDDRWEIEMEPSIIDRMNGWISIDRSIGRIKSERVEIKKVEIRGETGHCLRAQVEIGEVIRLEVSGRQKASSAPELTQVARHLGRLLEEMTDIRMGRIRDLEILNAEERSEALRRSRGKLRITGPKYLPEIIEEQAKKNRHVIAVTGSQGEMSYEELNRRANQLGRYLRRIGVWEEVVVGICMERSLEMVVSVLGVLKAGGAYLPLDPGYPMERLRYMMEDCGVSVILTQEKLSDKTPNYYGRVVYVDSEWENIASESDENLRLKILGENLAYIIYTSGSTGRPKGVMVEHNGLQNLVKDLQSILDLRPSVRVLQFASLSFDASVYEIFKTLSAGATLCLCSPDLLQSESSILQYLKEEKITTTTLPPSVLSVLPNDGLDALNTVIAAGEPCLAEIVSRWRKGRRFLNAYGPTEVTVCASIGECKDDGRSPSVGMPIANTSAYALDSQLRILPPSMVGELYLGGVGLARGYRNQPALTAERFIPNPFTDELGTRLYGTGDLARHRDNGEIDILGRTDTQVKIRGFRVDLSEIDSALNQHPAVAQGVVILRDTEVENKYLVAYVVSHQEEREEIGDGSEGGDNARAEARRLDELLRNHLKKSLPDFMIPSWFIFLDRLPLTQNGKIDRRALSNQGYFPSASVEQKDTYQPARSSVEHLLVKIWEKALGVERIGVNDNFFRLGGDSIIALQIAARARDAGLWLTAQQVLESMTIAESAKNLDKVKQVEADQGLVSGPLPLTPIQRWFFEQEMADPHHYNQAILLEPKRRISAEKLKIVTEKLIERHDALRIRFRRTSRGWGQFNEAEETQEVFSVEDLSGAGEEWASEVERRSQEIQRGLDLFDGPLIRVAWFDLSLERAGRILIVIHHLVVDGVSWRILLEDLQRGYEQIERGEEIVLGPKTTSYKHWAEKLEKEAEKWEQSDEMAYWEAQAKKLKEAGLREKKEERHPIGESGVVKVSLSVEETRSLITGSTTWYDAQIQEILVWAVSKVLGKWLAVRYIKIDLEGHGRESLIEEVDVTGTVGWFTSFYPAVLELAEKEDIAEEIGYVKEQIRRIPRKGLGYGVLRYLSKRQEVREKMVEIGGAEIGLNYLGQFDQVVGQEQEFRVANERIGLTRSERNEGHHQIEISAMIFDNQLEMEFMFSSRRLGREDAERLARECINWLKEAVKHGRTMVLKHEHVRWDLGEEAIGELEF